MVVRTQIKHCQQLPQKIVLKSKISSINLKHLKSVQKLQKLQMPFLFKTQVKQSSIHGKGVFALEHIPQGSVYWVFECPKEKEVSIKGCISGPNNTYKRQELEAIKDPKRLAQIFHGGFYYEQSDIFIELCDGTHFMNHNEDYNSQIIYNPQKDYKKLISIAWKDIKVGDEITQFYGNYYSSKGKWVDNLMKKYFSERINFQSSIRVTTPLGERNK